MNPIRYRFLILFAFLLSISFCLAHTRLTGVAGVSPTGAATYSVAIEVPKGVGDLKPSIGIAYNSQSGNGVVGWGCSITGLSVITRGIKDVAHDGTVQGVKFQDNDAYYLDGKRLILMEGTAGTDGAVYAPEGEPLTLVTLHGSGTDGYFTADTGDGMTYEYGHNDGRQLLEFSTAVAAWYISKAENALGQTICYHFLTDGFQSYLQRIDYGCGNTVTLEYEDRQDAVRHAVSSTLVTMSKRLKTVSVKADTEVFRTYAFTYDSIGDGTSFKFSRLTEVTVTDSDGHTPRSLTAEWENLPSFSPSCTTTGVTIPQDNSYVHHEDRMFLTGDLTGDGISDFVQLSHVKENYNSSEIYRIYAYISRSNQSNGMVSHREPILFACNDMVNFDDWSFQKGAMTMADLDGDGFNDLILPVWKEIDGHSSFVLNMAYGNRIAAGNSNSFSSYGFNLTAGSEMPLYTLADLNMDGRTDIVVLEKEKYGFTYRLYWYDRPGTGSTVYNTGIALPSEPQHIFSGDYNHDGLTDLLVVCESSSRIFYNNGGQDLWTGTFNNSAHYVGSIFHHDRIDQGDFNGDGIIDFVWNDNEDCRIFLELGNADGTFTRHSACSLDISLMGRNMQRETWSWVVADFDRDGRSDVVFTAADYSNSTFSPFNMTHTYWLRSTGTGFSIVRHATSQREDDAKAGRLFVGDFSGRGITEVGNYGYDCCYGNESDTNPVLHVYRDSYGVDCGKVKSFTDSDRRSVTFTYAPMTSELIYTKGNGSIYPVIDVSAPLCVVSKIREHGASPVTTTNNYSYQGLRAHLQGRGLLGFRQVTTENIAEDRTVTVTSGSLDPVFFRPRYTTIVTNQNAYTATSVDSVTLQVFSSAQTADNYMAYPVKHQETDIYGNVTTTLRTYDMDTGCLLTERSEDDGGDMWRQTSYTYPLQKIGGAWRPTSVTTTQQHADSPVPFTDRTETAYDTAGLPVTVTEHAGTALALTHSRQYDCRGNILSETHSGSGIPSGMTTTYTYDTAGRFPTGSSNGITTMSYTYDIFGNLLSESDVTRSDMPLTTSYTRDAFGDVTFVSRPSGASTFRQEESSTQHGGAYCVNEYTRGGTATYTWYDALGNETYSRWLGVNCEPCGRETTRNARGQITSVRSWTGKLSETRTMTYDELGRLSTENDGAATTSYSYGNRTVTTTRGGRSYTKISDAWGNILESTDPVSSVSYTYHSCGKPATASSGLSTVSMQYDAVGNRTVLDDPDAGCMSYEYDALGRIHRQTDARGVETSFTYDAAGRLTGETCGGVTTSHVYGTSGAEYQRLVRSQTPTGTVDYTYDAVGRVASETHSASGMPTLTFGYHYNQSGQLSRKDFPQGVSVDYHYDGDGNFLGNSIAGRCAGLLVCDDGQRSVRLYGGSVSQMNMGDVMNTVASIMGEDIEEGELRSQGSRYATGRSLLSGQRGGRFNPDEPEDPEEPEEPDEPGEPEDPGDPEFPPTPQDPENPFHDEIDLITGAENPQMILVSSRDAHGYPAESSLIYHDGTTLHTMAYGFEASTGNLLERTGMVSGVTEEFTYDAADRIVASGNSDDDDLISYDAGGNIIERTTLGNYYYGTSRPHAVTAVDNAAGCMSAEQQQVVYNAYGKAAQVTSGTYLMNVTYGPDRERWKSVLQHGDTIIRTTVYADGYERITENGVTRHFYYLDSGALYMLEDGQTEGTFYYAMTDHLGSITALCDSTGTDVFRASYDVWGCQQVTLNSIGLHRGYTGHEMLPELGLINMNGRMYDPETGRFLSPDNYVQMPDYSQSFNRYSYCLNNPLKYTDPSGELFGIDDAIIAFAAFNMTSSMMQAAFNGESVWKAGGLSLLSSVASYGIGSAFGPVGNWGNELLRAGAHGIASGAIGALSGGGFGSGFVTGALSSGIGSFAQGVNMNPALMVASTAAMGGFGAWLTGGNVMQGVMQGMSIGFFNHAMHEGEIIKHKDGTLEVVDPLPEVTVRANHNIHFRPISEKPLESVYPEFAIIVGCRSLFNFVSQRAKSFFSESSYTEKVKAQMSYNDYHGFPSSVEAFENNGVVKKIIGGDGKERLLLEIRGWYKGKDGGFQFIKEQNGEINHRLFVPYKK